MKAPEWILTQPFKAAGLYGGYQWIKEEFKPRQEKYFNTESLLVTGGLGIGLPLTARAANADLLEDNGIGAILAGAPIDLITGYAMIKSVPDIANIFPGTEHMLGGAMPFLIAFAGRNLLSHFAADVAGLSLRKRNRQ